jgi:diguanylate cyclase (GGDEF)-like protein
MEQLFGIVGGASGFLPHGYCLAWDPALLWTTVISHGVIGLSYFSIPFAIFRFMRGQRDLKFNALFLMFGVFILACGTTHFIGLASIWYPEYRLEAAVLALTAGVSLSTAIVMWPLVPEASRYLDNQKRTRAELQSANARLEESYARLQAHSQDLTAIGELSAILQACQSLDEMVGPINRFGTTLFPRHAGALYLVHASRNYLECVTRFGGCDGGPVFGPNDCWGLRRGQPHWHGQAGLHCQHVPAGTPADRTLCVPVTAQGEVIGIAHLQTEADLGEAELQSGRAHLEQIAAMVADRIGIAVANVKLRESLRLQSIRDPLTKLLNRRYLEESLPRELGLAKRQGSPLSVLMIDVDHFKQFNDTFGHEAGDVALRTIGEELDSMFRGSDIACRFGGEEFAVVLPQAAPEQAQQKAQELCGRIRKLVLLHKERVMSPVTLSVGVAGFPQHSATMSGLIDAADQALYRAKRAGRDQVVCSEAHLVQAG